MERQKYALAKAALFFSLLAVSAGVNALPMGYGVDRLGDFYAIDLTNGVSTFIGASGIASPDTELVEGLAMNGSGELYATTSLGKLYSVNSANGSFSSIGDTGRGNIEGLDFRGNELLGIEFDNIPAAQDAFSIDLGSAGTTDTVTLDRSDILLTSAMAVQDANTALFAGTLTVGSSSLLSLDLGSGATTLIGDLDGFVGGLDFAADGTLYGLGNMGRVLRIDPLSGATTTVGTTGSQLWLAFTTYTVPTPGSAALLIIGLAGLMVTRQRRG
jgi:hypothetical protein